MRKTLILPVAFGSLFAALSTAHARPVQPGAFVTAPTETQAQAIVEETLRLHPSAEVHVSYDVGTRRYTVEVKPRETGGDTGAGEGAGGE